MRRFQPRLNIAHRFIAYLMVLSILPLLGLGIASVQIAKSALEIEAGRYLTQLVSERRRFLDLQTDQIEDLIANVSGVEGITNALSAPKRNEDNFDRLVMQARIGYILNGYTNINGLISIDIFSSGGAHYHVGETLDVGNLRQDAIDDLRQRAAASDRPVYWAGIVDNVNGNSKHAKVIAAAKVIRGIERETFQEVPIALLLVNYSVEYLRQQFEGTDLESGVRLAVIDDGRRLVYDSDASLVGNTVPADLFAILSGGEGGFSSSIDGADMLVRYVRSDSSGWLIAGFVPRTLIAARTAAIGKATGLVVLICLVVAIVAATFYSRSVVAPLRRITARFQQLQFVGAGLQGRLPVRGRDDVADLTRWFNIFLDRLQDQERAELALQASEARFRTIFEGAGIGMAVTSREGRFILVNHAFQDMVGYDEDELRSMTYAQITHPDDIERSLSLVAQLESGRLRNDRFEKRYISRDGKIIWARVTAALFPEAIKKDDYIIASIEDITGQKQAEAERRARQAAEAANEAKSVFLASMSHELRTPLNVVLGLGHLLERTDLPPEAKEDLSAMLRSGEHLHALINQVLDLSKIEAGRSRLNKTNFDLGGLLDDLERMCAMKAQEKGVRLALILGEAPRYIRTDQLKLRQVLLNLLDNALKFTESGSVSLRVATPQSSVDGTNCRLAFTVSDTGAGIAPEELAGLCGAFVQAEAGLLAREGTGLGLAISRGFVQLMGGELRLESQPGHGTAVSFEIPVEIVAVDELPVVADRARRVIGLAPDDLPCFRVLIADDRSDARRLLVRLLAPLGFELREAANGEEAIAIFEAWQPHLIWMDIRMPVLDGREATRRIKATAQGRKTTIIAVTASSFEEDRTDILASGCDDFLRKPFEEKDIYALLERHLGVSFVYEEDAAPRLPRRPPDTSALASLPSALRERLEQALIALDVDGVTEAIRAIGANDAELAEALLALAGDFQYDRILLVIKHAAEKS